MCSISWLKRLTFNVNILKMTVSIVLLFCLLKRADPIKSHLYGLLLCQIFAWWQQCMYIYIFRVSVGSVNLHRVWRDCRRGTNVFFLNYFSIYLETDVQIDKEAGGILKYKKQCIFSYYLIIEWNGAVLKTV